MINISHHGAVSGVTGSCHELSIAPSDRSTSSAGILIDCGLFQGADAAGKSSVADLFIDFPFGD